MNRAQWEVLIRRGADSHTLAEEALRSSWQLPAYIGEAITPPLFLAEVAVTTMGLLASRYARRGNPYRIAAFTILGGSAYLEPLADADPRSIVMTITDETHSVDLADCLAWSSEAAIAREITRIGRTVQCLDAMGRSRK